MAQMNRLEMKLAEERAERQEQEAILVQMQEKLHSQTTAVVQSGAFYGSQPPEEWLLGDALVRDFEVTGNWYNVREGRPESRRETHLRMRIVVYLRKVLPKEFLFGVRENDVAAIYAKLVNMNTAPAELQRMEVRKKLANCEKGGRPLLPWLNELYDLFDQLEGLRVPATVQDLRSTFLWSLKDDKRYNEVVSDLMRNPNWDLTRIRMALEAAAYAHDDLVAKPGHSGGDAPQSRAQKRKTARAAKLAKDAQPAHPKVNPKSYDKKPSAEREARDKMTRDRLAREICPQFLIGACAHGDSCWRKHVTAADIKAGSDKKVKAKAGKDKSDSQDDLKADKAGSDRPKTKLCFQWTSSGSCTYGDNCHFSHDSKVKGHVVRTVDSVEVEDVSAGTVVKGTDQIFSGLVQLNQELPKSLSDLRGTMAQAFGIRGENTLMQVHGATPGQDTV